MRGNQIILVAILLVIVLGAGSYLYFSRNHKNYLPSAFAVPESAVAVYQGQHFREDFSALMQNDLYHFLSGNSSIDSFNRTYSYLDSLLRKNEDLQQSLSIRPLVVSLHVTAAKEYQLLFLHQTEGDFDKNDLDFMLKQLYSDIRLQERKFEETDIYDVKMNGSDDLLSFAFINGILAISKNPVLVEDAINAYGKNKNRNNYLVEEMVEHLNESKVYINFKQWPDFLNTYLQLQYHEDTRKLAGLASVGVYDIDMQAGKNMLRGDLLTKSREELWQSLLAEKAQPVSMPQVLPSNTAVFMEWGVGSFASYYEKYKSYLEENKKKDNWDIRKSKLQDSAGILLDSEIVPLIGNDWGYAVMEPVNDVVKPDALLLIKTDDTSGITDKFKQLNEKAAKHVMSVTAPLEYRSYEIDRTNFSGVFEMLFGEMFADFDRPFYTRLGDYLVFGDNTEILKRAIDGFLDNQTLSQSAVWKQYSPSLASNANFTMFIDPARSIFLGKRYVDASFSGRYQQNISYYKGIGAIEFQLVANDKNFFCQIILQQSSARQGGTEMAWSQSLETEAMSKPFVVDNGKAGEKEILIQDQNLNLYLINNSGNVLWKKKLDDALVGEVYTVDYYKNGQKEMLFATENYLHLLDHNGKEVGNYPIRLGAVTNTGIALFDFRNDQEYEYFVGVDKGKIYGFDANGKPLGGWSPLVADSKLSLPLKYFTIKDKVYLFGVSDKGMLYVWDEKGRQAAKPIELKTRFNSPFKANIAGSVEQTSVFSLDTAGVLYTVKFDGSIQKRSFRGFGNKAFFDYLDTDGNGKYEYVISGGNKIAAYEKDTFASWSFDISSPLVYPPQFVNLDGRTWIGYTSVPENVIYLRSRAGTQYTGFPARGSKPFAVDDLNGDGQEEMVTVGDGAKLYLYRIGR